MFSVIRRAFRYASAMPTRLFGIPKRLLGLPFPLRVALVLSAFLSLLTVTAFIGFLVNSEQIDRYEWFDNWRQILLILALLVAIPVVVYHALKLWLEPNASLHPEIDRAWTEGIAALKQNGLDIGQLPLFLIIGSPDETRVRALMRASGFSFCVQGEPEGRVPLQWYANDDAVFIVSQGLGCLGEFTATARGSVPLRTAASPANVVGGIKSTLIAGRADSNSIRRTAIPGDNDGAGSSGAGADAGIGIGIRGTLVTGGIGQTVSPATAEAGQSGRTLSPRELDQASEELEYVCNLIRKSRQPLCALNGMLALLPVSLIHNAPYMVVARELPNCLRRDLSTIRDTTKLLCPVTFLVTGMESEPGFNELIRRIGIKKSQESRFGKGYKLWNPPTSGNLDALAMHACGAFEDWVYAMFRDADGLRKTGNGKLYSMLCTIRSRMQSRLRSILQNALGIQEGEPPTLFGGCYFAATGETEDNQAFVRSALEKMLQQEEELEWTPEALLEDARYHKLAQLGTMLNAILVLILIGLAIFAIL